MTKTKTQKTEQKELKNSSTDKRIKALDYETNLFAFIIYNLINRSEEDFITLEFMKLNLTPHCRRLEDEKFWLDLCINYDPINIFSKLEQSLGLKYKIPTPVTGPITQENIYGEEIDLDDEDTAPTTTLIKICIPTKNTKFIESYDDYIEVYKKNGLTGKDLVNFELQEAKIKNFFEQKLKESGNEYFWLSFDEIKSFDENNRVSMFENLQYNLSKESIMLENIIYLAKNTTLALNSFSKFKLNLRAPNKSENKFEKIDSIIFEFDDYEQLKNVIINGENLNLSAGKLKVLRDIRKSKGLDEIGSNSLSSQVSKINSAFKEFQKQHGIFDTKHLINPKNDEGMYTINDDFCSLIKKERKKLLRKINCWQ